MSKNKTFMRCIIATILACGLIMVPVIAYGSNDLTADTSISIQGKIADRAKKEGYKNIIKGEQKLIEEKTKFIKSTNNYLKKWKKYLTKEQKKQLSTNKDKALESFSLAKIKKYKENSIRIIGAAKQLQKDQKTLIKRIKTVLKEYKILLTGRQRDVLKNYIIKVRKCYKQDRLWIYREKTETIVSKAIYIPGKDTNSWSFEKISFVREGGNKNNTFLAGTPMEGLGYTIAEGAGEYNVDPAVLSAIAKTESGCGVAPYGSPYNAYGGIWGTPYMSSGEDGIGKWYDFFGKYFGGDIPVSSMHGYGGYGIGYLSPYLEQIRNA